MMVNKIKQHLLFTLLSTTFLLSACNGFFEKDNTPTPTALTSFKSEAYPQKLWSVNTGSNSKDTELKRTPILYEDNIITATTNGTITATNKITGQIQWQVKTDLSLMTGPGAGNHIIAVGSRHGDVIALNASNGRQLWKAYIPGEILANPAIGDNTVIVKAIDGYVHALSITDGKIRWSFQQVEPNLILRGASTPLIHNQQVIIGFANGNLAKLGVNNGQLYWQQPLTAPEGAFAIERMIDVDADPFIYQHHLFAATYQGKIVSLDLHSGKKHWSHDISSYTGMTADANTVYISDARGHVYAFDNDSGLVKWRQTSLESRVITAPAIMGNTLVLGDKEGYLHWLNKQDGHFIAREYVGAPLYATPLVDNNRLYAQTKTGYITAYTLN